MPAAGPPNSSSQLSGRPGLRLLCFDGDFGGGGKALLGLACCERTGESSKSSSQFSVDFVGTWVRLVGVWGVVDVAGVSCSAQCVRFFLSSRIVGAFISSWSSSSPSSSSCAASQSELAMDMRFGRWSCACFVCELAFGCFVCCGWNSKSSSQFSEGTRSFVNIEYGYKTRGRRYLFREKSSSRFVIIGPPRSLFVARCRLNYS